jgi:hypothetical protein
MVVVGLLIGVPLGTVLGEHEPDRPAMPVMQPPLRLIRSI